jgi:hypothetical protein
MLLKATVGAERKDRRSSCRASVHPLRDDAARKSTSVRITVSFRMRESLLALSCYQSPCEW